MALERHPLHTKHGGLCRNDMNSNDVVPLGRRTFKLGIRFERLDKDGACW